jgi:hypothetical protein
MLVVVRARDFPLVALVDRLALAKLKHNKTVAATPPTTVNPPHHCQTSPLALPIFVGSLIVIPPSRRQLELSR